MLELMSWRVSRNRVRSVASALRAVRLAMCGAGGGLTAALAASVGDDYKRASAKKARHWPHKKRDKPPGSPVARIATEEEWLALPLLDRETLVAQTPPSSLGSVPPGWILPRNIRNGRFLLPNIRRLFSIETTRS